MRIAPSDMKGIAMTEDLQGKTLASEDDQAATGKSPRAKGGSEGRHNETTANASLEKVRANLRERARVQGLTVEGLPRSLARRLDRPQPSRMSRRSSTRALEGATASVLLPSRGWRTGRVDSVAERNEGNALEAVLPFI
jgi:hypothetical protein